MKAEMETLREVWNGEDDFHYEIGPDRDGTGCVEVRYMEGDKASQSRMSFPPELAKLVGQAMQKCAAELAEQKQEAEYVPPHECGR